MRITGGFLKNRFLAAPKTSTTRPTSEKLRQSVFNILQHQIKGAMFLDLFAGSGAMGIEALSHGTTHATFVEKYLTALRALRSNLDQLSLSDSSTIFSFDALVALKKLIKQEAMFDVIYVDPPYTNRALQQEVLLTIDTSSLLKPRGILLMEANTHTDLQSLSFLTLEKKRQVGSSTLFQFTNK